METDREGLLAHPTRARAQLDAEGVLRVRGWWSVEQCRLAVARILGAREHWTSDFDGLQFCVGRAWYTHLETDQTDQYFAGAAASNALVERVVPGLQADLHGVACLLATEPALRRPDWCGAGVHLFPAGGWCANRGGAQHFDEQGLTLAQQRARAPAWSLVLMLQPPESGGGLRIWEARYTNAGTPTAEQRACPSQVHEAVAGDLVVFDSFRLHQIMPFGGGRDRISATLHAARGPAAWETWF